MMVYLIVLCFALLTVIDGDSKHGSKNNDKNIKEDFVLYGSGNAFLESNLHSHVNDNIIIEGINNNNLEKIRQQQQTKIVYVFSTWCDGQSSGLDSIIKLSNNYGKNTKFYFISTDPFNDQQMEIVKAFLDYNGFKGKAYILEDSIKNLPTYFAKKPKQIIEFIGSFDSTYRVISLPYMCVISPLDSIVYKMHPHYYEQINAELLRNHEDKDSVVYNYFKNFSLIEVERILNQHD